MPGHREGHGFDFQHFRGIRPQESQRATAVGAGALAWLDRVVDPLEVLRQVFAPSRLPFLRRRGGGGRRDLRLRHACLEFFEAQHHLLDALEPFGGLSEAKAPQFGELELQVLDLPLLRAQIDTLCRDECVMLHQQSL
jgi:hypothetical protein